ncbi:hypothetical protein QTO34_006092 [Cnephaeus nilssonii]|uniref:DDE-1 domain-containing protein n=1 Tax=Cnephaeus nilssonii TaxID=3371016 RepID=A0AA40LHE6_CNENI|nr:hypothetical protein QTO34_006092 [Eptesicus nilssonii]
MPGSKRRRGVGECGTHSTHAHCGPRDESAAKQDRQWRQKHPAGRINVLHGPHFEDPCLKPKTNPEQGPNSSVLSRLREMKKIQKKCLKPAEVRKEARNIKVQGEAPSADIKAAAKKSMPVFRAFKDRLTLFLGVNATNDFQLRPVLIFHTKNSGALKNNAKSILPLLYKWNNKAWMAAHLFSTFTLIKE